MALGDINEPITSANWQVLAEGIILYAEKRQSPLTSILLLTTSQSWATAVLLQGVRPSGNDVGSRRIVGGIDSDYPARFLWVLTQHLLPQVPAKSPFEANAMAWRLFRLFQKPPKRLQESALINWLDIQSVQSHWQLAQSLSAVFQRYRLYADDWLSSWVEESAKAAKAQTTGDINDHESWQKACWLAFLDDLSTEVSAEVNNPLLSWVEILEAGDKHPKYAELCLSIKSLPFGQIHLLWGEPLQPLYQRAFSALMNELTLVAWRWLPITDSSSLGAFKSSMTALYGDEVFLNSSEKENSKAVDNDVSRLTQLQSMLAGGAVIKTSLTSEEDSLCIYTTHTPMEEVEAALQQLIHWLRQTPARCTTYTPTVALVITDRALYAPLLSAAVAALPSGTLCANVQSALSPASEQFFMRVMGVISGENDVGGPVAAEAFVQMLLDPSLLDDHGLSGGHCATLLNWIKTSGWRVGSLDYLEFFPDAVEHGYESARERWLLGWFDENSELSIAPNNDINHAVAAVQDTSLQQGALLSILIQLTETTFLVSKWARSSHSLDEWLSAWQTLMRELSPTHAFNWQRLAKALAKQHQAGMDEVIPLSVWQTLIQEQIDTMAREIQVNAYGDGVPINIISADSDNMTPHDFVLVLGLSAKLYPSLGNRPVFDLLSQANQRSMANNSHFVQNRDYEAHIKKLVLLQWLQSARLGLWLSAPSNDGKSSSHSSPKAQALLALEQSFVLWDSAAEKVSEVNSDLEHSVLTSFESSIDMYEPTALAASQAETLFNKLWQIPTKALVGHNTIEVLWSRVERDTADPVKVFLKQALDYQPLWRDKPLDFAPLTVNSLKSFAEHHDNQSALIQSWLNIMKGGEHDNQSVADTVITSIHALSKKWSAKGQWPSGKRGQFLAENMFCPWLLSLAKALTSSKSASTNIPSNLMVNLPSWQQLENRAFYAVINEYRFSTESWAFGAAAPPSRLIVTTLCRDNANKKELLAIRKVWMFYVRMLFHQAEKAVVIWRFETSNKTITYYPPPTAEVAKQALSALVNFWSKSGQVLQPFTPAFAEAFANSSNELDQRVWQKGYSLWHDNPFSDSIPYLCWQSGWQNDPKLMADRSERAKTLMASLWQPMQDWWNAGVTLTWHDE